MAKRVFEVIERPDMIHDQRFSSNSARVKNRDEIDRILGEWFAQYSSQKALELMRQAGVTAGPVYSISDATRDAHFVEREIFIDVEDLDFGTIKMNNLVPRLSQTPGRFFQPAPELGADTDQILCEIGYDSKQIEQIKAGCK